MISLTCTLGGETHINRVEANSPKGSPGEINSASVHNLKSRPHVERNRNPTHASLCINNES